MLMDNETFDGTKVDFTKVQKYNRLANAARFMDATHLDVIKVNCPPLSKGRVRYINATINRASSFNNDRIKRTLAGMIVLCDGLSVNITANNVVNFTLFVDDIRTK
ncbi:MAG: hypothetical protein Q4B48_05480 [Syntrophomonadaceae bacterium]|nr:hypothetical protein [Syntrophomonadaceae bacterium]